MVIRVTRVQQQKNGFCEGKLEGKACYLGQNHSCISVSQVSLFTLLFVEFGVHDRKEWHCTGSWYMVRGITVGVCCTGARLHAMSMSCLMARAQRARRAQELARAYDIIACHSYADISINLAP